MKTQVKQVTIIMTIKTLARADTVERWLKELLVRSIKEGLDWEAKESYEIQQMLIEDVPDRATPHVDD